MSRFSRSWALCAALLWSCLVAFSCHPQPTESAPAPRPRADLRLLVLTDPRGYLEPCGCQARMLGGVDKLATTVAARRKDGVPSLLLAAGDLAFGTVLNPKDVGTAQNQEQWRAETLIDVWKSLGMAAVAPGPLDLASPAMQKALAARGGFPWLSENVSDSEGKPWSGYTRARVVNAGAVKVGVFGLVAPSPAVHVPEGARLDEDLSGIAKKTSDALRSQGAQIVVLLLSGDRRVAKQLAARGPDVVVLGGADSEEAIAPSTSGGAVVVNAGRQGQRLLTLDLTLRAGAWHDASTWTADARKKALQTERDELAAKIASWEKDPKVAAGDLEAMRHKLGGLERDLAAQGAPRYDGRWFAAEVTDLAPEVPDDARVKAIMAAHDLRVNQANAKIVVPPVPVEDGKASYVGSEACRGCHTAAYEWWRSTKHGRAYDTLVKVNKQFNLSCVGCHVVGYQKPGGSTVTHLGDSGVLKDVGCESCHGPGSLHVQSSGDTQFVIKDPSEGTCVTCHNHEHSERFQYQAFRSLLIVPGHGKPLAGAPAKGAP